MSILDRLTNFLMSRNEEEYLDEENEFEDEWEEESVQETRKVVNGSSVAIAKTVSYDKSFVSNRPKLVVHETKIQELAVQIHSPLSFDQVKNIADDFLAHKAVVVNYEKVEPAEQRRICDFLNGICYIVDGEPRRISEQMVIYVPSGVDVMRISTSKMFK